MYWGYFISPPSPPVSLAEFKEVTDYEAIELKRTNPLSRPEVRPSRFYQPEKHRKDRPYSFNRLGLSSSFSRKDGEKKQQIYERLAAEIRNKLIIPPEVGTADIYGDFVVGSTQDGQRTLFLTLTGMISDDHYIQFESTVPLDENYEFNGAQSSIVYFYDVAGIEGLHWFLLGILIFAAAFLLTLYEIYRRFVRPRLPHRRCYPQENGSPV